MSKLIFFYHKQYINNNMFRDKQQDDFTHNLVRQAKANRKNNRVFILQYSPERTLSKKKNNWENKNKDQKKLANYILKKEMLREQIQEKVASSTHTEINHKFNIDRLINLISKSRATNKNNNQSGCEKMVRALLRVNTKLGTYITMKEAVESLKKFTMTCSSHNYQLFLQSRHLNLRQTQKLPENMRQRSAQLEKTLQKIAEYADEYLIKNENSGLSITHEMNNNDWNKTITKRNESTVNNKKLQSADYLTTRQELLSLQTLKSPLKEYVESVKNIQFKFSLKSSKINIDQKSLQPIVFQQKIPPRLLQIQKDKLPFTISQNQQNQVTFNQLKNQIDKCLEKKITPSFLQKRKSNSPILSLMFALPTEMNELNDKNQIKQITYMQSIQNINTKQPEKLQQNKSLLTKSQIKKQQVLNANQYAQFMLFGNIENPQTAEQKVSKEYRTFLQEKSRKRISSLPKITFTYISRDKYEAQNKIIQKNQINTLKLNKSKLKQSFSKNSSKQELHSTFQSKHGIQRPRQNVMISHNPFEIQQNVRTSNNREKLVVMHQPFGSSKIIRNEYYGGETFQTNRQIPQTLQMKRQRILTAQPNWQKEVEFVGIEQQMPGCCWQQKEVRSRSMNDRILVRTNSQNNIFR